MVWTCRGGTVNVGRRNAAVRMTEEDIYGCRKEGHGKGCCEEMDKADSTPERDS